MSDEQPREETSPQPLERKLAAIFSADVKGYSRLMGTDEAATIRTLTAYREVMLSLIPQHRGRVVDSPGDNLLAEFSSAVDAIQGAVAIQRELKVRNAELPSDRKMEFRIGINVGDVVVEGERIYGDGVNIAARLESLAEGGSICISGTAYDQIKNKLPLAYAYQGEQTVKNIAEPVRVYAVQLDAEAAVSGASPGGAPLSQAKAPFFRHKTTVAAMATLLLLGIGMWAVQYFRLPTSRPPPSTLRNQEAPAPALSLPDKPSIAVLPFTNMSGDPAQEYFSDGITEDIITDLSKISGLFVIARNSTFTYKGAAVKVQQVSQELGVQYVLEGSVRAADKQVRINAQLVDATTGGHLWAERYDRGLQDIFAVQDEIAQKIVFALKVALTPEEQARFQQAPTDNLEAYDVFLRGLEHHERVTQQDNAQARQLFEQAIDLDPEYASAYTLLGWTYLREWILQWNQDPHTLDQAYSLAQKALSFDDSVSATHQLLSHVYLWKKQHGRAIAAAERAIALEPNDAACHDDLGNILAFAGKQDEAIEMVEKGMRLNPHYSPWSLFSLGHAYYLTGRYEEAVATLQKALARNPDLLPVHAYLAASYNELGWTEKAQAAAAECERLSPDASLDSLRQSLPYEDPAALERLLTALREVGLE